VIVARDNLNHGESKAVDEHNTIFGAGGALQAQLTERAAATSEHLAGESAEDHKAASHRHGTDLHVGLHVHVGGFDGTGHGRV
jgi:hypothetical protein